MAIRRFLDKSPLIDSTAYVDESAVIIGDVRLGKDVSIWPMVVARGDHQSIIIGDGTNVQDGTVIHIASSDVACLHDWQPLPDRHVIHHPRWRGD
jgi:carbonic anhydrase/acetyltransferase-like protein (isoleucine patch superfamily)